MTLTNIQIFSLMGFTAHAQRNALIADFLSGGLEGLGHLTEEDVKEACSSYAKRSDGNFPIILTTLQKHRLKALMIWVKDRIRVQQAVEFEDGTNGEHLKKALDEAIERKEMRKEQKKVGESFHDHSFNNKLKSQAQYEKFNEELESTLAMIIGSQGVTLNYVIRENEASVFDDDLPYHEAVIEAVKIGGPKFVIDTKTVHQIILQNVHEDSDAYTYINPLLRSRDGRKDMLALCDRYSSEATKQAIINQAKATLEMMKYRNERSFSFEKFSAKLQKAYDKLEEHGREVHNGDIVDALWTKLQDSSLQTYLASLRVEYQRSPRTYKLILQDVAAEVASKKSPSSSFTPNVRSVDAVYTRGGTTPDNGVHTQDGSIYIGGYDNEKWLSDSVKPHHKEILEARQKGNDGRKGGTSRNDRRRTSAVKRNKRKLTKLKAKLKIAQAKVKGMTENKEDSNNSETEEKGDRAGDSFGGEKSRNS